MRLLIIFFLLTNVNSSINENIEKLYHSISHNLPKPRTVLEAWREMRETWKIQIKDSEYFYDTPIAKIR